SFQDRVGSECRRDENGGNGGPRVSSGLSDGIEDWHFSLERLAAFARGDPGDDLGAVFEAQFCVVRAETASHALDENFRLWGNENGHVRSGADGLVEPGHLAAATAF